MPDDWFIETLQSNSRCSYRNTSTPLREFHFTVGGDSFAPTALASMLAKYHPRTFHAIAQRVLDQASANTQTNGGYPLDAKRFREAIEATARKLDLPEELWWRCR